MRNNLGMRRTKFRPRTAEGELVETPDEKIVPDFAGAARLSKEWKFLVQEMVAVGVAGGVLASCVSWMALRTFLPLLWGY